MHKVLWFCESVVSLIPSIHCCFVPECPLRLRSCIPTVPLVLFAFSSVLWFCVLLSWVPTVTLVLRAYCPPGHLDPLSLFSWVPTDPLVPCSGYFFRAYVTAVPLVPGAHFDSTGPVRPPSLWSCVPNIANQNPGNERLPVFHIFFQFSSSVLLKCNK